MNLSTLVQIQASGSEQREAERRSNAMFVGYYAENGPTFDPSGKYLCATCKARVGKGKCAWVDNKISFTTGSCMLYMIGDASEKELPKKMSQTDAKYTERPNVKAFGCTRCEYGKKAVPDSGGRSYNCTFWKMHVMAPACCMMNEGEDDIFAPADNREVEAGGSGSGCHGDNCGRPSTGSKAQQTSGPRQSKMSVKDWMKYIKEHTQTGGPQPRSLVNPKKVITQPEKIKVNKSPAPFQEKSSQIKGPKGSKPVQRKETIAAPIYKKAFDKDAEKAERKAKEEMQQWKGRLPATPDKGTHNLIMEGTLVKNNVPVRAFDNDRLEFKNYKAGTVLTVQNVLPSIGSNPRMISVKFPGSQGDIIHVPENQLNFYKTAESQKEKPVHEIRRELGLDRSGPRPGQIQQESKTGTGERYIQLKPQTAGRPTGSGNFMKKPAEWSKGQPQPDEHPMKGQFALAKGPRGNKLDDIFTLDLNMKSFGQGTARATVFDANKKDGSGTTVVAWRDTTNKTGKVLEFNRDQNGYIKVGAAPAANFKNIGHMSSYLSKRYDISLKLPKGKK